VCLLEAKAAVNVITKKGDTALSLAIWKNHSETAIVLLDAKANPTNVDNYGDSVLHDLSRNDNIRVMLELLDCLKDPNFQPLNDDLSEKNTSASKTPRPKHLSVCGHCQETNCQLQNCSRCKDIAYCSRECQIKHWKLGHKLVCKPAKTTAAPIKPSSTPSPSNLTTTEKNEDGKRMMVVTGGPETLQRMVDVRNKKDMSPLSCAITSKKINMVRLLLDMKAEVTETELYQSYANPEMKSIVEKALEERKLPLFKDDTEETFLAKLASSSSSSSSSPSAASSLVSNPRSGPNNAPPAVWAAERGNVTVLTEIFKTHLKSLLDEDDRGWDPMLAAANGGRASALLLICEAWTRNDRQMQKELSREKVVEKYLKALGAAIAQQQTAAAMVLLSDSFLEALDISGEILDAAPLVALAVTTKNLTVLKELAEVGASVASKDSEGETALHIAIKQEKPSIKMIRVLLDNGAVIDEQALAIRGLD